MHIRQLSFVFCLILAFWIFVVPATYIVTLNENIFVNYLDRIGFSNWLLALFVLYELLLIPISLTQIFRFIWSRHTLGHVFGIVVGISFGLWATTLLLTLPYIGVYPNIPSAIVGTLLSRGSNKDAAFYLSAFVTNMVMWPIVGWLIFGGRNSEKESSTG